MQKITNWVDWILSKRVSDVITMFIASVKISARDGNISPSSFYGQLPVLSLIYPVREFSCKEMETLGQSKILSFYFMFSMSQKN